MTMRTLAAGCCLLLLAAVAPADDADDARALVDRAVRAVGGDPKLRALTGGTWKTNSTVQGRPSQAEFRGEIPGRFRHDGTRVVDGVPVPYSRIVDGDKGWVVTGGEARPMTPAELAGVRSSFEHKQLATTLLPLLGKDYTLQTAGQAVVGGRPVSAVKASRPGRADLTFYFDPETGLLTKSETTDTSPATGKARKVELEFSDYRDFDGVKLAGKTKAYHDGELFIETELTEFRAAPPGGLPPGSFRP
jgi:hypothetical protein